MENLAGERDALSQRAQASREQMEEARALAGEREAEAARLEQAAREKLAGQSDLLERTGKLSEEVSRLKADQAGVAAQREATEKALGDLEQVARDMAGDRESRLRRLEEHRTTIADTEREIARRTEEAASLRLQAASCQDRLRQLQEGKLRLEQERTAMGTRLKECNEAVLEAEREAARLEQRLSAGNMEEKQLLDKLWETYELSHSAAMELRIPLESTAKSTRRIGELKREISGLGSVNVGAIDEFQRVNSRYTYLTDQRSDVQQAKRELEGIIQEITKEMTAIF